MFVKRRVSVPTYHGKMAVPYVLYTKDEQIWKDTYNKVQADKYKPGYKKYSKDLKKYSPQKSPEIYIVQRIRGGPSYKEQLNDIPNSEQFYYVEASKGYRFSDLSPYVAGPVIGKGINVLNTAFSGLISVQHIEGGTVDLSKKYYWSNDKKRDVELLENNMMLIDGILYNRYEWLESNTELWYDNWQEWNESIRLSGEPSFKWLSTSDTVTWCLEDDSGNRKYYDYNEYMAETYGKYLNEYWDTSDTYHFVRKLLIEKRFTIVIVHPIVTWHDPEQPITIDYINDRIDEGHMMNGPFVLAHKLAKELYNF